MRKTVILIAAVLAVLLLAGCAQQQNQPAANAGNNNGTVAPPAGSEPAAGNPLFDDFAGKFQTAKFMAEYEFVSSEDPTNPLTMKEYIGFGKIRIDNVLEDVESRTIMPNVGGTGEIITCVIQEGAWQCIKMPTESQTPQEGIEGAIANPENFETTYDGTMTVAGYTGQCFKMVGKTAENQGFENKACFTSDGVLLYSGLKMNGESIMTTTAKSISMAVSESDFVPPAEPQEYSSTIPQQ